MNFTSHQNFKRSPFAVHPEHEFVMVSKSPDWVADHLEQNWELCAIARRDEDESIYWAVGLPVHLEQAYGGFSR